MAFTIKFSSIARLVIIINIHTQLVYLFFLPRKMIMFIINREEAHNYFHLIL